jgi:hypothetical protein
MILILSSIAIVIEYAETMLFPAIPDIIRSLTVIILFPRGYCQDI